MRVKIFIRAGGGWTAVSSVPELDHWITDHRFSSILRLCRYKVVQRVIQQQHCSTVLGSRVPRMLTPGAASRNV